MKPRTIAQDLEFMAGQLRADAHNYGLDPRSPRIIFRDRERQARTILARVPSVTAALQSIREQVITGPEKRAVQDCIDAVERILGNQPEQEGGGHSEARLGVVRSGRQSAGDSADTRCTYCGQTGGHTGDCPVIS